MELVTTSVTWHVYAITVLTLVMIFNLYSVLKVEEYLKLAKRLKFMTPIYHATNLIVAYTGGIVAAFSHDLSITVVLMIATSIFVMILEIKRYKAMRVIKTTQCAEQILFRIYAKKLYMIQISAIVLTYFISKTF